MQGEKLMAIQYLFDENVDPAYPSQIRRRNPDLVAHHYLPEGSIGHQIRVPRRNRSGT